MKILLVQAHTGREEPELVFPVGLAYLAGALTTAPYQHEVQVFDPNIESDPYGSLSERIQSFIPDVVGISQPNIDTADLPDPYIYLQTLQPTLQLIRRLIPETIIIIGGTGFSLFPERIMRRIPEIDFGIVSEGEQSFPELLAQLTTPEHVPGVWYRRDKDLHFSGIRTVAEFDKIPQARYGLLEIAKYSANQVSIGIESKRGYPLKTIDHVDSQFQGESIRARSPQIVVNEIEWLVKTYQISRFVFVDSVFNMPKEHAQAICQEIINRNLSAISWSAGFDVSAVDEDFIRLARTAGCTYFFFSPDAITDSALQALQKNFSVKDILQTIKLCKKLPKAVAEYSFYLNTPGLTFSGYLKTIWFILKEQLALGLRGKGKLQINWLRILPKTELYHIAVRNGLIPPETDLFPIDEADLPSLFYRNPKFRVLDYLMQGFLHIIKL